MYRSSKGQLVGCDGRYGMAICHWCPFDKLEHVNLHGFILESTYRWAKADLRGLANLTVG